MKRIFTVTFFLLASANTLYAQKEDNFWYFGDQAGLNFSSGSPVAVTNGALFTYDNSSTISDSAGNLLFYTNSVTVWNKNHVTMFNGTGIQGNTSAGQSALIVRQPGTQTYFIFTVGNFASANGFRYSTVDMTQQGGLGAVVLKNQLLFSPSTEKIDGVYNCADNSFWILTHEWNSATFRAYKLSSTGLNTTPVNSTVGSIHSGGSPSGYNAMGQMTLSKDGSRLACAIYTLGNFELFDFNVSTGIVSNPIIISGYPQAWGTEFSQDESRLYVTQWYDDNVIQFDLTQGTQAAIAASAVVVGTATGPGTSGYYIGYLQRGPDDKIYAAVFDDTHLAVVNNPNLLGLSCNFVDNGVNLGGKLSQAGLSRVLSINYSFNNIILSQKYCFGDLTQFYLTDTSQLISVQWNFGDPTTGSADSSNLLSPGHVFSSPGNFLVTAIINYDCITDTVQDTITINQAPVPSFTANNFPCTESVQFNNLTSGANSYVWFFGDGTTSSSVSPLHVFPNPGNYTVILIASASGCSDTITQQVIVDSSLFIIPFTFNSQCDLSVQFLNSTFPYDSIVWIFGDGSGDTILNPVHTYASTGTYSVTQIISFGSCIDSITQTISVDAVSSLFTASVNPCEATVTFTNLSVNANSYQWDFGDGSTDTAFAPLHTFTNPGNYNVTLIAFNNNCNDTMILPVSIDTIPLSAFSFSGTCDSIIVFNNLSQNYFSVLWNFGDGITSTSISPSHTYSVAGNYIVTLITTSLNGCTDTVIHNISVALQPSASFTFNLIPCTSQIAFQDGSLNAATYSWNFGDGGSSTIQSPVHTYQNPGNYAVTLISSSGGCNDTAVLNALIPVLPDADFASSGGCDSTITFNNLSQNYSNVIWNFGDGSTSNLISPVHSYPQPGTYLATLIISDSSGCTDTITKNIDVLNPSEAGFFALNQDCDSQVIFLDSSINASTYLWLFGDGQQSNSSSPVHTYQISGNYTVTLVINAGTSCEDSVSFLISVQEGALSSLFVPNVFTPNNDGKNEVFELKGTGNCLDLRIMIFNRWGQMMFETDHAINVFWNGTYNDEGVPDGVYVYILESNSGNFRKEGFVTVLR